MIKIDFKKLKKVNQKDATEFHHLLGELIEKGFSVYRGYVAEEIIQINGYSILEACIANDKINTFAYAQYYRDDIMSWRSINNLKGLYNNVIAVTNSEEQAKEEIKKYHVEKLKRLLNIEPKIFHTINCSDRRN